MLKELRPAIVLLLAFTLITGILYPYLVTGIAQAAFPVQANGSLIRQGDTVIGSALIGQNFAQDKYFHGRPSATTDTDPNDATKTVDAPYNAASSTGSNLGPISKALIDRVTASAAALKGEARIPVDLVTTSASGLDPDITPAGAEFQIARVAAARGLPVEAVRQLVASGTEERSLGVLGEARVNVLALNLALDRLSAAH